MMKKYLLKLMLLLLLLLVSFSLVQSFEVKTLNGSVIDWKESFCLQDPDDFINVVGDDYYAYCEYDFSADYNSVEEVENISFEVRENISINNSEGDISDATIESLNKLLNETGVQDNNMANNSNELNTSKELANDFEVNDSSENLDDNKNNDWFMFFGIIGVVLVLVLFILIISHKFRQHKDRLIQMANLKPYLNTLIKRGYSREQLEDLLLRRGYESSFINELLKRL